MNPIFFTVILLCFFNVYYSYDLNTSLNQFPIILSHDAATGELNDKRYNKVVDKYAQTQSTNLVGQLDCGSRGFDYRPYLEKDGELIAHHGGIKVHKKMSESITEVINWANHNQDELILFYMSHYDGEEGCKDASLELIKSNGINNPVVDCNDFKSMTLLDAINRGKLENGGSILVVSDCVEEEYDPSIECYNKDYVCYDSWPKDTKQIPMQHLADYMINTTNNIPVNDGRLWMVQAHWQSSVGSITLGEAHLSSILQDEEKSNVNQWIATNILNKTWNNLNLIEVDNVCNGGNDILNAIRKVYN
jgi:hypothetical protein